MSAPFASGSVRFGQRRAFYSQAKSFAQRSSSNYGAENLKVGMSWTSESSHGVIGHLQS